VIERFELTGDTMQELKTNQANGIYIITIQTAKARVSRKAFIKRN
jgi:hypothetical protein